MSDNSLDHFLDSMPRPEDHRLHLVHDDGGQSVLVIDEGTLDFRVLKYGFTINVAKFLEDVKERDIIVAEAREHGVTVAQIDNALMMFREWRDVRLDLLSYKGPTRVT